MGSSGFRRRSYLTRVENIGLILFASKYRFCALSVCTAYYRFISYIFWNLIQWKGKYKVCNQNKIGVNQEHDARIAVKIMFNSNHFHLAFHYPFVHLLRVQQQVVLALLLLRWLQALLQAPLPILFLFLGPDAMVDDHLVCQLAHVHIHFRRHHLFNFSYLCLQGAQLLMSFHRYEGRSLLNILMLSNVHNLSYSLYLATKFFLSELFSSEKVKVVFDVAVDTLVQLFAFIQIGFLTNLHQPFRYSFQFNCLLLNFILVVTRLPNFT